MLAVVRLMAEESLNCFLRLRSGQALIVSTLEKESRRRLSTPRNDSISFWTEAGNCSFDMALEFVQRLHQCDKQDIHMFPLEHDRWTDF